MTPPKPPPKKTQKVGASADTPAPKKKKSLWKLVAGVLVVTAVLKGK